VEFDHNSKRAVTVSCYTSRPSVNTFGCSTVGGITTSEVSIGMPGVGTDESSIVYSLGQPNDIAYDDVSGVKRKILYYNIIGLTLVLIGREVVNISISPSSPDFVWWLFNGSSE
jgi:hypothetical protein